MTARPHRRRRLSILGTIKTALQSSAASRQAAAASNEYVQGIFAHAMEEAKKPRGAYRSALLGAETRCKLLIVIADVEAETGVPAVFVASDTGDLMEHPRLTLVLENDDLLRAAVPLCFPSVHNIREQWPSVIAAHRDNPNTPDMLRQKAGVLAMFILATEYDVLENAALWYRVIDEEAFVYIREDRDLFADYLQDSLAHNLALQGYAVDEICGTMAERSKEYAQYRGWRGKEQPTRIVLSDGTESTMDLPADGTLLCEAFKHFKGSPERLNYNFGLQFVQAHVYELLTGKEMPARR
jgi:hypothetical protein